MAENPSEFAGIFEPHPGSRPVMTPPPRETASRAFIFEVADLLAETPTASAVADWIADKMARFGARTARPVFDMEGYGPQCSWCGGPWPLCGHQHVSEWLPADDDDDDDDTESGGSR